MGHRRVVRQYGTRGGCVQSSRQEYVVRVRAWREDGRWHVGSTGPQDFGYPTLDGQSRRAHLRAGGDGGSPQERRRVDLSSDDGAIDRRRAHRRGVREAMIPASNRGSRGRRGRVPRPVEHIEPGRTLAPGSSFSWPTALRLRGEVMANHFTPGGAVETWGRRPRMSFSSLSRGRHPNHKEDRPLAHRCDEGQGLGHSRSGGHPGLTTGHDTRRNASDSARDRVSAVDSSSRRQVSRAASSAALQRRELWGRTTRSRGVASGVSTIQRRTASRRSSSS